jgi:hypothetical protein
MKEIINEHDMTKKMMEIMRGGFKTRLMTENTEEKTEISPVAGDAVFNDELTKLQDIIHPSAMITNFKIYPNDRNVIIDGTLQRHESEDSGIDFKMALSAGEVVTSMKNLDLTDEISELLKKLKGYYSDFAIQWYVKVDEYKNNNNAI